jgi:hypothetical protein
MMNWGKAIKKLSDKITDDIYKTESDPLIGDDTEKIGKLFELELNIRQGNITQEEYNEMLARIEKL